jgi:hypothetical protein
MAGGASETYRVSDGFPQPKRDSSFIIRRGVTVQIEKEVRHLPTIIIHIYIG